MRPLLKITVETKFRRLGGRIEGTANDVDLTHQFMEHRLGP